MSSSPPAPLTPLLLHELPQVTYLIHMLAIYSFPCSSSSLFLFYFSLFFISSAKSPSHLLLFPLFTQVLFWCPADILFSSRVCSCRCPSPLKSQQVEEKSRPCLLAARTSTTLVLHCPVLHQGNIEPLIEFHFHRDIVLNNALGEISNFVFLPPYRRLDDIVTRKISDERRACAVETEMRPSIGTRSKPGNENNLRMFLKVCMHRTYLRTCHCLVLAVTSLRWWSGEEIFVKSQSHKIWGLEIRSVVRNGNLGQKKRRRLIRAFRVRALTLSPSLILNCCHLCSAKR